MHARGFFSICTPVLSLVGALYAVDNPPSAPAKTETPAPHAYEWPAEKDKKYQISSTFGESRLDHFHNGIDLPGQGSKVLAPRDGRVLYRTNADFTPGEMPYGGGNTLILEHKAAEGVVQWSGYMHLKSFSDAVLQGAPIALHEKLGISGNTGHSGGPHLHFFIFEPARSVMLNPLLWMSDLYYADKKTPESKEWGVLLPDKFANVNPEKSFRLSADYPVYIFLTDRGVGKERWGIFEYQVKLDGKAAIGAKFDEIYFKNGAWSLASGLKFEDLYFRNLYALTNQVRRAKKVSVDARDLKGNTFSKTFELKIQQN